MATEVAVGGVGLYLYSDSTCSIRVNKAAVGLKMDLFISK